MSKKLGLLLCVTIPSFMMNLDSTIVSVSMDSVTKSFHGDFSIAEWVITAYTLAFATLVMASGTLSDRFGRKKILLIGLATFTLASGMCGLAGSLGCLIFWRGIQGAGASLQLSAALAILSHSFHGRDRARAFSFFGSVIGFATMMGPAVGGVIIHYASWRWAFFLNLPIGATLWAASLGVVGESTDHDAKKIDFAGTFFFSGFLAMLTLALTTATRNGWDGLAVPIELALSIISLIVFGLVETNQKRPMMDLNLFVNGTFSGASVAGFAYAATFIPILTFTPLFFQRVLEFTPLDSGLLMLPLGVPLVLGPRYLGKFLAERYSGRAVLAIGLILISAGLLLAASAFKTLSYPPILLCLLVAASGAGILSGQIAKISMSVVPANRAGMASGMSGTMRFSGIVIGFSALSAVLLKGIQGSSHVANAGLSHFDKFQLARFIFNGNNASADALLATGRTVGAVKDALLSGYSGAFLVAGLSSLIASAIVWMLISGTKATESDLSPSVQTESVVAVTEVSGQTSTS